MSNFDVSFTLTQADVTAFEQELAEHDALVPQWPPKFGLVGDWAQSVRELLVYEGGYTNHPADPGGPTNWGITIFDVHRFVKPDATAADVKALKVEQAKDIYKRKYWDLVWGDKLPAGVDFCVFDYGVNSGPSRAVKALQRVVGVDADGVMGPATLAAVLLKDPAMVVNALCDERMRFLRGLKTFSVFGVGWTRRVTALRRSALGMIKGQVPAPKPTPTPAPKPGPAPAGCWLLDWLLSVITKR